MPGKINVVADALSRQSTSVVNAVFTLDTVYPKHMMEEQRKDPMWNAVICSLESGEDVEIPWLKLRT